ncbi:MAG: hypothetical protein IJQ55_05535, partial [Alphaproteobacteria bacterium]|nr:hypothetical protein [Alphaproteobacteria bacterium]
TLLFANDILRLCKNKKGFEKMSQYEETTNFTPKAEQLTYADVAHMFDDLKKSLHVEKFSFSTNLSRPEGGTAVGFAYTGYAAGAGLRNILNAAKIYYAVVVRGGTGISENSEIQIEDMHEKKMLDLMNNIKNYKQPQKTK